MVQPLSITQHGRYEPFYLQAARGQVQGHRIVIRTGLNPDVDTGIQESLWDHTGLQVPPAAATLMTVSSTSASDTAAGVGAHNVVIAGLDASYNEITEVVPLNGLTGVSTVNQFFRVHNVSVVTVGSSGTAVGDIYIGTGTVTAGIPAVIYGKIRIGWNTTQMIQYTFPAGWTAYLLDITGSSIASATNQYTLLSIRSQSAPAHHGTKEAALSFPVGFCSSLSRHLECSQQCQRSTSLLTRRIATQSLVSRAGSCSCRMMSNKTCSANSNQRSSTPAQRPGSGASTQAESSRSPLCRRRGTSAHRSVDHSAASQRRSLRRQVGLDCTVGPWRR